MYFHSIIARHVVNLRVLTDDLRSVHTTPNFSFITPNLCNDGHDGDGTGVGGKGCVDGKPGGLTSSDTFLRTWVPRILNSPAYKQSGLLIITFDESDSSPPETRTDRATGKTTITTHAQGEHCCGQRIGPNVTRPVVETFIESPTVTYLVKIEGYGGDRIGAILLSPLSIPAQSPIRPTITIPFSGVSKTRSGSTILAMPRKATWLPSGRMYSATDGELR